jgi:hypothetical protein
MAEHPDRAFFQACALTLVTKVLSDIRCWAEQPHPEPLPKDWDCTYRRDLSDVIEQAVANFAGDSETVARLRRTERLARDVVSAMSSSFAVSSKPAVEWPEAYAAYFQKMLSEELFLRELRDSLDAKDRRETKRRRQTASDTHTAAPSDAGRIGRDELHDRNGVSAGGTSVLIQEPRDSGTRNMNSELNGIDGINTWLQQWWSRAGAIVANYDDSTPEDPWAWQGWLAAGVLRLPGTIGGESVAPLIEFLQGIIALWEPSETQGPKPTKSELLKLSSRAWVTYNRLQVMIGKNQEGADVAAGGGTSADTVAEPVGATDAIGGGVYPDSSTVTAKQLAFHAGVTDREIRKQLKDSPYKTDNHGRKLFDYASALPVLRNWCEGTRTITLNSIQWPTLAENLKTLRPERKKK